MAKKELPISNEIIYYCPTCGGVYIGVTSVRALNEVMDHKGRTRPSLTKAEEQKATKALTDKKLSRVWCSTCQGFSDSVRTHFDNFKDVVS